MNGKRKMLVSIAAGAAMMGWGGGLLAGRLGLDGLHQTDLPILALGIIFMARAPYYSLAERLQRLEAEQKPPRAAP